MRAHERPYPAHSTLPTCLRRAIAQKYNIFSPEATSLPTVAAQSATTPRCKYFVTPPIRSLGSIGPKPLIGSVHLLLTLAVVRPVPAGAQHERDWLCIAFARRRLAKLR